MAIGDAAAAAGFPLVDGATTDANTIDTEINRTRDLVAGVKTTADGALPKTDVIASGAVASPGKVPRYDGGNRFQVGTPLTGGSVFQVANKQYADSHRLELLDLVRQLSDRVTALEAKRE